MQIVFLNKPFFFFSNISWITDNLLHDKITNTHLGRRKWSFRNFMPLVQESAKSITTVYLFPTIQRIDGQTLAESKDIINAVKKKDIVIN